MLRTWCLVLLCGLTLAGLTATKPLQTFVVKDYLQHAWTDELVHFLFFRHDHLQRFQLLFKRRHLNLEFRIAPLKHL